MGLRRRLKAGWPLGGLGHSVPSCVRPETLAHHYLAWVSSSCHTACPAHETQSLGEGEGPLTLSPLATCSPYRCWWTSSYIRMFAQLSVPAQLQPLPRAVYSMAQNTIPAGVYDSAKQVAACYSRTPWGCDAETPTHHGDTHLLPSSPSDLPALDRHLHCVTSPVLCPRPPGLSPVR